MSVLRLLSYFFFFNDTATTEIYTLSLHDALPIFGGISIPGELKFTVFFSNGAADANHPIPRSEEHTSELQSQSNLVCRLLLEKKKKISYRILFTYPRIQLVS